MTVDDLNVSGRDPRAGAGNYRGYDIVSMPLPSSGGTVLLRR
jgi:gamma-glutamyltranspeptidase/glutathione hydrolase